MAAGRTEILIEQGSLYDKIITVQTKATTPVPIDLTGFGVRGMIRKRSSDASPTAVFTCTVLDQIANPGKYRCVMNPVDTSAIPCDAINATNDTKTTNYIYDFELYSLTDVTKVYRLYRGVCKVSPEATK